MAVAWLSEEGPFRADIEPLTLRDPHPGGQASYVVRFQFPWHREPCCPIKIEITFDEPVQLDASARAILPSSSLAPPGSVKVYALEEIVADKLRALLQTDAKLAARGWCRSRARDYYDLWNVLTALGGRLEPALVREILPAKCRLRAVSYSGVDAFFTGRLVGDARANWHTSLSALAADLPPFETVLRDLPPLIRDLLPE